MEYLQNPIGNTDRKIRYRALSYVLMGNELLKKTSEGLLLKCLGNTEAYLAISEVHSGMASISTRSLLAKHVERLYRIFQRLPRVSGTCKYSTCVS